MRVGHIKDRGRDASPERVCPPSHCGLIAQGQLLTTTTSLFVAKSDSCTKLKEAIPLLFFWILVLMQFNYSHALSDQEVGHYCICNNSLHTNTAKRANDEGWDHSLTTRLSVRIFQVDLDLKKEQQIVSRTVAFF